MSKKKVFGQKIQSTIVGFLAKTTNKNNILQSSTPKSVKEEKIDLNDESLDDLCFDKQRKLAGDLVTIDTIIDLDNSDNSDSCKSPIKAEANKTSDISEPYYVENSVEEKERFEKEIKSSNLLQANKTSDISEPYYIENSVEEKERFEKEIKSSNLLQMNTDEYSAKTSFIPESSDSENDKENIEKFNSDISLNLKDLGFDKQLNSWIESVRKEPVMSTIPITRDKLLERRENLKDLQIEILYKFFNAFELIPLSILEQFPNFNPDSFIKLQDLHRHVKAKLRLMQTKLSKLQKEDENDISISLGSPESLSSNLIDRPISHISESCSINNDFDTSITTPSKKSTFQLKRPVKAVLNPEISKTIAQMWEKDQQMSKLSSSIDLQNVPISIKDTLNDTIKTSPETAINMSTQKDIIRSSPNNWINSTNKFQSSCTVSTEVGTLTQELEKFPVLGENCNIDINDDFIDWPESHYPQTSKNNVTKAKSKFEKNSVEFGKFTGNYKNDGISGEFDGLTYSHSQEMLKIFRQKFGLYTFRPNQLQAINATLLKFDCFVLMPTGGGKSLCYQLPALLTVGLTVVISPLKSLILDQVQKLISLDIPAAHLSGSITDNQAEAVYRELAKKEPALKILYITPEKLSASTKLCNTLTILYERQLLARFVIDEAHCVSQWGHDFRPDYKRLKCLRDNYPKVPTMALTATATPRVRTDILHQLGMTNPKWFMSGFNRPNLRYSIISKKGKNCSDEVITMIMTKFRKVCGIVYCLSRKDCDNYAAQMKKNGIKALSYHAGLTDNQRSNCQGKWISDEVHVICATIAFGMGIDKPNVRFVIHAALPKSIEGYYQESGRAGRDGEIADCILFYNYADMHRIRKMLELDNPNPQVISTHMDNLFKMVAFCENTTDCRRSLQLNYFGEIFDRQECISNETTACDNCRCKEEITILDATEDAKEIMKAVREINNRRDCKLTLKLLLDIFKGSDLKKIRELGLTKYPVYGRGKSWDKSNIERLLHYMVLQEYLLEEMYINNEIACAYLKIGPKASELMTRRDVKVQIPTRQSNKSTCATAIVSTVSKKIDGIIKELQDRCYAELMTIIRGIANTLDVSASSIMNMVAIRAMSQRLPDTEEAMLQIPHVTKANFVKYGKALLEITQKYAAEKIVLENENEEEQDNDDNDSTWDDNTSNNSRSSNTNIRRGRKRKIGSRFNSSNKKYRQGGSSAARGRGSSRNTSKNSATRSNATTKKMIGLAHFSQTKQYLTNPNRYMPIS